MALDDIEGSASPSAYLRFDDVRARLRACVLCQWELGRYGCHRRID